jgi:hypothetical protein
MGRYDDGKIMEWMTSNVGKHFQIEGKHFQIEGGNTHGFKEFDVAIADQLAVADVDRRREHMGGGTPKRWGAQQ